jgi:hypothetical protein
MKRFLHWTAVLVLVLFVLFGLGISLRSACHECLAAPSVAECQRSNGAVDLEIHSEARVHRRAPFRRVYLLLARGEHGRQLERTNADGVRHPGGAYSRTEFSEGRQERSQICPWCIDKRYARLHT